MKKLLFSRELKSFINKEKNVLGRSDFQIFIASTADDILKTHRTERVDLIIMPLDMEGGSAEEICSLIRKDEKLNHVSLLIICNDTKEDIKRLQKCKPNAHITNPIIHEQLIEKIKQLLIIPVRQDFRILLKVTISGKANNIPFFCYSYNISVSGMLIETNKVLQQNDIISCSFFLPLSEQIITNAEIMRIISTENNSLQYGIRFINLAQRYKTAIEAFINRRSGKSK
jgi:CheY-like chemotaxis protein